MLSLEETRGSRSHIVTLLETNEQVVVDVVECGCMAKEM